MIKGAEMKWKRIKKTVRENPVYLKAGILAAAAVICFVCVYIWDNSREIQTNENGEKILERDENGKDQTCEMKVRIGDKEEEMNVSVSGRKYNEEELKEAFTDAGGKIETLILGENESLDEVRHDLDLITEIPGTGITVSWQMDRYDVIDSRGCIQEDALTEEGTLVKLTAVLSYEGEKASHEFYIKVFPPILSSEEKLMEEVESSITRADEETRTENYMVLPDQVNGEVLQWEYGKETRAASILILGVGAAFMLIVSDGQRKKEEEKKQVRQMKLDYPKIVNKFNLYIRAGMTIRRAWFMIVRDYEKKRSGKEGRRAYDEMVYAMHQIRGGIPEGECYEKYGMRCNVSSYRKFGTLLAQNLRKGSGGLTEVLGREAEEAFEDRKNLAKKLGEEAGTKLMIPMFLMLIIVFAIVIIPAFFSIQI